VADVDPAVREGLREVSGEYLLVLDDEQSGHAPQMYEGGRKVATALCLATPTALDGRSALP
jgi:hypothetical protein